MCGASRPGADPVFLGRWELWLWRRPCCAQQPPSKCTLATLAAKSSIEHITWRLTNSLTRERGRSLVHSVLIVQHWRGMSPNICRHAMRTASPSQVPLVFEGGRAPVTVPHTTLKHGRLSFPLPCCSSWVCRKAWGKDRDKLVRSESRALPWYSLPSRSTCCMCWCPGRLKSLYWSLTYLSCRLGRHPMQPFPTCWRGWPPPPATPSSSRGRCKARASARAGVQTVRWASHALSVAAPSWGPWI